MDRTTVDLPGGTTIEFVWINCGTFAMGSPEDEPERGNDEGPQRQVTISQGFWLSKSAITQRQWEAVMGTRPWEGKRYVWSNPEHPAVYISWNDVQAFLQRLNESMVEDAYRLPTEAEWEYACRAGTTTRWSFGDDEERLGEYAWYEENAWYAGKRYAQSVGVKLPNPWGLYDMHGNIWEWVQDWYGPYPDGPQDDPQGPLSGPGRVARGGFFSYHSRHARSAVRYYFAPDDCCYDFGFRLIKSQSAGLSEPIQDESTAPKREDLPVRSAAPAGSRTQIPAAGRVLIVEDEQLVATVLRRILERKHLQVEVYTDGQEALEQLDIGQYDVAFIDLGMPGSSGDEIARQIRELDPTVARVLFTGWELKPEDPRLKEFDFQLQKSMADLVVLEELLKQALELHQCRASRYNL